MTKVFMDMAPFTTKSNGVICVFLLYSYLIKKKLNVFYVPRNIRNMGFPNLGSLPFNASESLMCLNFKKEAKKNDWLICNDTTPKKLLNIARKKKLRIIFWQLAPYSFLGRKSFPNIGEYNLPFSSCVDPFSEKYFYYQPEIDIFWKNALALSNSSPVFAKKDSIAIYTGKGRIKNLPKKIKELFKENNLILLTRNYPDKRSDLFTALLSCNALITFDAMTQLNLEAASIGLPVFVANKLLPDISYEKFPVTTLKDRLTSDVDTFINLYNQKINGKMKILSMDDLQENNKKTFEEIFEIITNKKTIPPISFDGRKKLEKFTQKLRNINVIHPHINGGQSAGIFFIKKYCQKLINQGNDNFLNFRIRLTENIAYFLFKLKILNVLELLFIKLIYDPYLRNRSVKVKSYNKNDFFNKDLVWKHNLNIDQIFDGESEKLLEYKNNLMIIKQKLIERTRFFNLENQKSKSKTKKNNYFNLEKSYLKKNKTKPFYIKYRIFDNSDYFE